MPLSKLIDVVILIAVVGLALWLGNGLISAVQAPAKLEAALGNNAALAKGAGAQNKAVDGLQQEARARKAKSEVAVRAAGQEEFAAAEKIMRLPPAGDTPVERAVDALNRELLGMPVSMGGR